jgi:hypothetical protein
MILPFFPDWLSSKVNQGFRRIRLHRRYDAVSSFVAIVRDRSKRIAFTIMVTFHYKLLCFNPITF